MTPRKCAIIHSLDLECPCELKALTALFTYRSEVPVCDADTVLAAKLYDNEKTNSSHREDLGKV